MKDMEHRSFDAEFRAGDGEDGGIFTVAGYAATFDDPYDLGGFREQIAPGAFDDSLKGDVRAFWNHDSSVVLGRTKSGTLRLGTDKRGLTTEIDFPASVAAQREAVERGDVDQMSIGFRAIEDSWEELDDDTELRTIIRAELFEVSPVAFPANPNTDLTVAKRSRDHWREERQPEVDGVEAAKRERELELKRLA